MKFSPYDCIAGKIARLNRLIGQIYRKHLMPFKITQSQLGILMMINERAPLAQAELAHMMVLERSTVSRDLKRLSDRGYLLKSGAPNRPVLQLTQAGKARLNEILPSWEAAMEESRRLIGEEGDAALDMLLRKLTFMK